MRTRLTFLATVILVALGLRGLAIAHTDLLESRPAAGEKVEEKLDTIELVFGEPSVDATILLLRGNFEYRVRVDDDDDNPNIVTGRIEDKLDDGTYQVVWSSTSEDTHTLSGSFSFEYDPQPTQREFIAGVIMIVVSLTAFIGILIWQRRLPAKKPT